MQQRTPITARRAAAVIVAAASVAGAAAIADAGAPDAEAQRAAAVEFFESRIRPVLVENCYECHSAKSKAPKGALRLDSADGLRQGGDSGPAIEAGKPGDSLLISALRYESFEMPPTGKLPDAVIADFEQWIAAGAVDPREGSAAGIGGATQAARAHKDHWAFQAPRKAAPPEFAEGASDDAKRQAEVDRFVSAKLGEAGLTPSPPADARTLLRRLSYDLTGLPPTAEELDAFATAASGDSGDAAYVQAVDRLLESPRFGERWGRYWLDIARYADTKGYVFEEDRNYPTAYKYRDWVIGAFNADLPYDKFIVEQLAADKLGDPTAAPAMGFLTLGRRFLNNPHDINDDRIDLITRGLMGLTTACARCHDHKFDPIPTADYYSLYGVLASSKEKQHDDGPPTLEDAETPFEPVVFLRGQPGARGPKVSRHFLSCLVEGEPQPFANGSGRLELAQSIASRGNPLTARVWVNRVWAHLFGRGLVGTPSDFGTRGDKPTHPELLDWLAITFMEDDWSTKQLIRRIVTSQTYRQSSAATEAGLAADPENRLLWRMNRRRLDLEAFRDSLLAASGKLDLTMGGPSVKLTETPFPVRRAVYGFIERQNLPAFFRTFDFANPNVHAAGRPQTASPQQALFMLNSPLVLEQAHALAERSAGDDGDLKRLDRMYRSALGRSPTLEEAVDVHAYLTSVDAAQGDRWDELAQVLLMSNEFMFVD
jgi:hypothetical protein